MARTHVVVIGGGVIGCSIALELARRDVSVTVLERGEAGHGCSFGNAGWLTPSLAAPLPAPGMFATALRWLGDPASPFYIQPRPSASLAAWLARFLAAMTPAAFDASSRVLVELSRFSLEAYAALAREHPTIAFRRSGLLIAADSAAGVRLAEEDLAFAAKHGVAGERLTGDSVREREPALAGRWAGGAWFPDEGQLDPLALVKTLATALRARGGELREHETVLGFETRAGRIARVRTSGATLEADAFVLATGAWSRALGATLGVRVPVLGGKGYSMLAPALDPPLRAPLYLIEHRVAISPLPGATRFAGTLELVDTDLSVNARRAGAILAGARRALGLPGDSPVGPTWAGLRPCTPDGVPIVGFAPRHANLLLATGHQMFGVQTAPATARLAAELLTGAAPTFDPHPLRASRFA